MIPAKPNDLARVLERRLCRPRGRRPYVLEKLSCGHFVITEVAAHWVDRKAFPKKATKKKICPACTSGKPQFEPLDDLVVLKEILPSLLEDFTQQVWAD